MNINKFGKYSFYLIGTCILLSMFCLVGLNFYNDSKLFTGKQSAFAQGVLEPEEEDSDEYQTLKYKRNYTLESDEDNNKKDKDTNKNELSVELIDYSKSDKLGAKIKATLENAGFKVTLVSGHKTVRKMTTKIIERNDKGAGSVLRKILKAGKITQDFKKDYKYDLTLELCDDYNP